MGIAPNLRGQPRGDAAVGSGAGSDPVLRRAFSKCCRLLCSSPPVGCAIALGVTVVSLMTRFPLEAFTTPPPRTASQSPSRAASHLRRRCASTSVCEAARVIDSGSLISNLTLSFSKFCPHPLGQLKSGPKIYPEHGWQLHAETDRQRIHRLRRRAQNFLA